MGDHNANMGSTTSTEKVIMVGDFPHIQLSHELVAGLVADLEEGRIMALSIDGVLYPYGDSYTLVVATGDGALKEFSGKLGPVEPGSVNLTDGTEAFADNGDGTLTGDAAGSGVVDYATGYFKITFNAAPADLGNISATIKNRMKGPLTKPAMTTDAMGSVCAMGPVNNEHLHTSAGPLTVAEVVELGNTGVWPIG